MRELNLIDFLRQQENLSLEAYPDSEGYITIGYGHNLEVDANFKGWTKEQLMSLTLTEEECEELFKMDVQKAVEAAERIMVDHKLELLNQTRQNILVAMVFQLGATGVRNFSKFLNCLFQGDFEGASFQMLDSKWKNQTGKRCQIMADIMARGGVIEPLA